MKLRAAVLTISDSCYQGLRVDRSGPAVCSQLESTGWEVTVKEVLPDDEDSIVERLRQLVGTGNLEAIFTTGGTGLGPRDVTPEATRRVIEKEIPGMSEHMRAAGRMQTPFAILSRGIAGVAGKTLIVNLPGSPSGAVQSLNAILDVVPHAVALIRGKTDHPEHSPVGGLAEGEEGA